MWDVGEREKPPKTNPAEYRRGGSEWGAIPEGSHKEGRKDAAVLHDDPGVLYIMPWSYMMLGPYIMLAGVLHDAGGPHNAGVLHQAVGPT